MPRGIPTSVEALQDYSTDDLRELCQVINTILQFCEPFGSKLPSDDARFDRDELGIAPEEDYEDELEDD